MELRNSQFGHHLGTAGGTFLQEQNFTLLRCFSRFSHVFLKSQEMSTPHVSAHLGLNNTFAPFLLCSNSKSNSFSQVFLFTHEMAMKECNNFLNSEGKTKYEKTFYLTTPRVSKNFSISNKQTRSDFNEFFLKKLFLFKFSEGSRYGNKFKDGVDCLGLPILQSLISLILVVSISFQRFRYLHSRCKLKYFAKIRKCFIMSIRLRLARQNFLRLCASRVLPLASEKKVKPNIQSHTKEPATNKHAISTKGKCRVKTWLCVQSRYIHTRYLVFSFIFLLLCGDVHPNPGPSLRPYR